MDARPEPRSAEDLQQVTIAELQTLAPGLRLEGVARRPPASTARSATSIVSQPSYLTGIAKLLDDDAARRLEGLPALAPARRVRAVPAKNFVDARFEFYGKALRGTPENAAALEARRRRRRSSRWARRSASSTSTQYFPPEAKARMDAARREPARGVSARASTRSTG